MMRPSSQALLRASSRSIAPRSIRMQTSRFSKRYASTVPADKPRTWKGSVLRWGLAGAVVYYYNTSNLFADQPGLSHQAPPQTPEDDGKFETLDSISSKRRQRAATATPTVDSDASTGIAGGGSSVAGGDLSPEELEAEAGQEGAFNPETGEINWDCPCLGGMAHGPCGEEFKAAFSCFVFSKEDPKGIDCIDNFKGMQDCFRQHPDIYGAELTSDDDDDLELDAETESAAAAAGAAAGPTAGAEAQTPATQHLEQPESTEVSSLAERAKGVAERKTSQIADKARGAVDKTEAAVADARASIEAKVPQLASRAEDAVKETQAAVSERLERAGDALEARKRALAAKSQVDRDHGEPVSESDYVVPKAWHDTRDANSKPEPKK